MGDAGDQAKPKSSPSSTTSMRSKPERFWEWAIAAVMFRLILIYFFPNTLKHLASRPEVSTPLTSLRRCNSLSYLFFSLQTHLLLLISMLCWPPFLVEILIVAEGYWLKKQASISAYAGWFCRDPFLFLLQFFFSPQQCWSGFLLFVEANSVLVLGFL